MTLVDLLRGVPEGGESDGFAEFGERLGLVVEPDELVAADGLGGRLGGRLVAHPENYPQPASGVKGA